MRTSIKTLATAAAAIAATAGFAVTAQASTTGCTGGVYSGYCGTQKSAETTSMAWNVYQQTAKAGTKIIAYTPGSYQAEDFFTFAYQGGSTKVFEYAPNGVASNLCISEPAAHAGLELRVCNGSRWQQEQATAAATVTVNGQDVQTFTWTNVATGDTITDPAGLRSQLAGIDAPATPIAASEFYFSS
jgi:hypothetical protein